MKICILGNSHAAMLMMACKESAHFQAPLVMAQPGLCDHDIKIENGILTSQSAELSERMLKLEMPDHIDLKTLDAIIIAGMSISIFTALRFLQTHDLCVTESTGHPPQLGSRPLFSPAALVAGLKEECLVSEAFKIASLIRQNCQTPIFFMPQPLPAVSILEDTEKYPLFHRLHRQRRGHVLPKFLHQACEQAFSSLNNTTQLQQPSITIAKGFLTALKYTRGAMRLNAKTVQPNHDVLHGNTLLGSIFLDAIQSAFEKP